MPVVVMFSSIGITHLAPWARIRSDCKIIDADEGLVEFAIVV